MLLSHGEGLFRQYLYESIHDFDSLVFLDEANRRLAAAGAPEWARIEMQVGFKAFDSIYRAVGGRIELPAPDEPFRGRHVMRVIGVDAEDIVFLNSWSGWGDQGRGFMSRAYFNRFADHASVMRTVVIGPSPDKKPPPSGGDWFGTWMRRNTRSSEQRVTALGFNYEVVRYAAISAELDCAVDVIEIHHPPKQRVGWLHLYHPSSIPRTSVVREFFVAPNRRREGWARIAETEARKMAVAAGSTHLTFEVDEADQGNGGLERAQAFLAAAGYTWEEAGVTVRPVLAARATLQLT